jgi:hypothetical protein
MENMMFYFVGICPNESPNNNPIICSDTFILRRVCDEIRLSGNLGFRVPIDQVRSEMAKLKEYLVMNGIDNNYAPFLTLIYSLIEEKRFKDGNLFATLSRYEKEMDYIIIPYINNISSGSINKIKFRSFNDIQLLPFRDIDNARDQKVALKNMLWASKSIRIVDWSYKTPSSNTKKFVRLCINILNDPLKEKHNKANKLKIDIWLSAVKYPDNKYEVLWNTFLKWNEIIRQYKYHNKLIFSIIFRFSRNAAWNRYLVIDENYVISTDGHATGIIEGTDCYRLKYYQLDGRDKQKSLVWRQSSGLDPQISKYIEIELGSGRILFENIGTYHRKQIENARRKPKKR